MAVKGILVLCGFLTLAAYQMRSLLAHFGTHLTAGSDTLLTAWILAWDVHALTTAPGHLFDANLMYPLERALAYSDHLLGVLPLSAPVYLLTGDPVIAANTVVVLSGALAAFGAFALAWRWTRRWVPAIVAGILFGFAPLRLSQIGHLQLLTFFWAPWVFVFLDRFLRARRWRDLWLFALFYWLQVLAAFYLGMMLTVAVVLYAGYYALAVDRGLLGRAMGTRVAAFAAASIVLLLPLHLPYLEVQRAWNAGWSPGGMVGSSADIQSYLSASPYVNDLYVALFRTVTPVGAHERLLFPGLILPALVLLGLLVRPHGVASDEVRRARGIFGLVAVTAFVLSLGPYLVVWGVNTRIPLPYLLLYYVAPGWSAMRAPARFAFLVLLAAVPLSALGVQVLVERVTALGAGRIWRRLAAPMVGGLLVALFLLELGAKPLPLQAAPTGRDVPEVYRWLARERPGPIVELPVARPEYEHQYVYASTFHWLPLVNGRSAFAPPSHDAVKAVLAELPGTRGRAYAAALGLRALVVHGDRLSHRERIRWADVERAGHLRRLAALGSDVVYAVAPVTLAPTLRAHLEVPETLTRGSETSVGLRLESAEARPWAQGVPHRIERAALRWTHVATGTVTATTVPVVLPLVVASGERVAVALRVTAPVAPGRYGLDVSLGAPSALGDRQSLEVREAPAAASGEGATRPAARYVFTDGDGPQALRRGDSFRLRVTATNAGGAVWRARPRGKGGNVALAWRWLDAGDRALPEGAGQAPIRYDVHPGARYEFDEWPAPPVEEGRYVLEAGLVTVGVGPFPDPPARIALEIERPVDDSPSRASGRR